MGAFELMPPESHQNLPRCPDWEELTDRLASIDSQARAVASGFRVYR